MTSVLTDIAGPHRLLPHDPRTPRSVATLFVVCVLIAFAFFGCATPRGAAPATANLRIEASSPEASVFIDDVFAGRASEWAAAQGRPLRAGFHRVELRLPEHYSYFTEVTLAGGTTFVVKATLQRRLD